jgi:uncharacterized peroxidase-related enzyme
MEDYRNAPLESDMKSLLFFAEKVARNASEVTADDIARLRSAGFSDRALLDAAHVAGFFSYMNRVVQAFGADTKPSIAAPAGEKTVPEIATSAQAGLPI